MAKSIFHKLPLKELLEGVRLRAFFSLSLQIFQGLTEGVSLLFILPLLSLAGVENTGSNAKGMALKVGQLIEGIGIELSLFNVLLIYVLIISFYSFLRYFQSINTARINQGIVIYWRNRFFHRLTFAKWSTYQAHKKSDFQNILTIEIRKFGGITNQLISLSGSLILILVYLFLSVLLSAQLTLFALLPIFLIGLLNRPINRKTHELGKSTLGFNQKLQFKISEHLAALKLVKTYRKEKQHTAEFEKINQDLEDKTIGYQIATQKTRIIFDLVAVIAITVFIYLAIEVYQLEVTELLLLLFIFVRLLPKVTKAFGAYQKTLNLLPSFFRMKELFGSLDQETVGSELVSSENINQLTFQKIEFQNVSFSYGSKRVLENTSFEVESNQLTLIKGPSGKGKSTVLDLIMGLQKPESGLILVDGIQFNQMDINAWKDGVSFVPQDTFLFHRSIRENLIWLKPNASEEELWKVLDQASVAEFVRRLPKGLDTQVGDRGDLISGGERQRIVLARALLRKPKLLLLDEATNELDATNTSMIVQLLEKLKTKMTIVVSTHQNDFDALADKTILL